MHLWSNYSNVYLFVHFIYVSRDIAVLNHASFITCSNLALVRADVSRLPFSSGSVDAVHAGAALHCWPSPSNAVCFVSLCDKYWKFAIDCVRDTCYNLIKLCLLGLNSSFHIKLYVCLVQ